MMINIRWVSKLVRTVGLGKPLAKGGSTATELGLIGAVVLIATIGFWFFLGDAVQYAFSFVRKDMVIQVSNANGLTPEAFVKQWKGAESGNGQDILNPVKPTAPVVTAGSNGNQDHAEIYKGLQALIDRSMKKATMTEAQADTLRKLVKQILIVIELSDAMYQAEDAFWETYWDAYGESYLEVYGGMDDAIWEAYEDAFWGEVGEVPFPGELFEGDNRDYGNLNELRATVAKSHTAWIEKLSILKGNEAIMNNLYAILEESGILEEPEVQNLLDKVWFGDEVPEAFG